MANNLLMHAVNVGDIEQCQMLIQEGGADVFYRNAIGECCVHVAVVRELYTVLELLLGFGADPNVATHQEFGCKTPLHIAVEKNNIRIATLLLESLADPNIPDAMGKLPVHDAAIKGFPRMAKLLLSRGSYNSAVDLFGRTPYYYAKRGNFAEIVAVLPAAETTWTQRREELSKHVVWRQRVVTNQKKK